MSTPPPRLCVLSLTHTESLSNKHGAILITLVRSTLPVACVALALQHRQKHSARFSQKAAQAFYSRSVLEWGNVKALHLCHRQSSTWRQLLTVLPYGAARQGRPVRRHLRKLQGRDVP